MEARDALRLEVVEEMESIEWPEGYEIVATIDLPAQFFFEGPNNYGGSTGRYGYEFEWPEGATGADRFRAMDAALVATGEFEGYEANAESLESCDAFTFRSYVHLPTQNSVSVRFDPDSTAPSGARFIAVYSYNPDGEPSARPLDRLDRRPGDPCSDG